ncbi:IclR family transcriptional regulator [Pigmentiphaga soli]|uniref:IclR family transcriptional regulator n=1 Tax=Pigmentiphaga soli TaxID=1007095 RepID=A0ABP8GLH7_9BURK
MPRAPVDRSVAAAERTLNILSAFIDCGGVATLPELEARTGLFKSVICRYLISLERHRYALKRADGKYQLGPAAVRLGKAYEHAFDLSGHVLPVLQMLSDKIGESASYYIREKDRRLCLYRIESARSLRVGMRQGSLAPLDDTATGQVFRRYADARPGRAEGGAQAVLTSSINVGGDEISSVSAPVFGADDRLAGALTVSGPMSRFDPRTNAKARSLLLRAAAELSERFGAAAADSTDR